MKPISLPHPLLSLFLLLLPYPPALAFPFLTPILMSRFPYFLTSPPSPPLSLLSPLSPSCFCLSPPFSPLFHPLFFFLFCSPPSYFPFIFLTPALNREIRALFEILLLILFSGEYLLLRQNFQGHGRSNVQSTSAESARFSV